VAARFHEVNALGDELIEINAHPRVAQAVVELLACEVTGVD
jgi:hypothetical protein